MLIPAVSQSLVRASKRRKDSLDGLERVQYVSLLLSVIPPSSYTDAELQRLVNLEIRKAFTRSESLSFESIARYLVWMPYYKVQFEYRRSENELVQRFGETARSETAINAMFCGCAQSQDDFILLFRPNYLKHSTIGRSPLSEEVTGQAFHIDLDGFLSGFLKRRWLRRLRCWISLSWIAWFTRRKAMRG